MNTFKDNFLPFALPEIGEEEIADVVDCLRSGWITTGPRAKKFEDDFTFFLGGSLESVAVNSATAGLHLALEAIGIKSGDEVITTTHTFTATAEVIRYFGAIPVLVDIDRSTLNIDIDLIEKKITSKTKAIMPVHFGGLAVDIPAIMSLAKKYNLRVIEDAAHALPASFNGTTVGSFQTDATIFSFYANKTMTTGEGGMLVTRDQKIAERARVMRLHGMDRNVFDRFTGKTPGWYYEVIAPGYKYNMTDIAAAIGIQQLKRVKIFQQKRAQIAETYNSLLSDLPITLPPMPLPGDIHSWHLYVVQLDSNFKVDRNQFIEKMFESGIGCGVHYIPLHEHPYWNKVFGFHKEMFPVSQDIYERSISIPIYSKMSEEQTHQVISSIKSILAY
ncbi:DegT/DnrJ/EryC1/StrS family aminotransferase [Gammaproteobacteria bacterium]|nr:DegT/DnrJ/EryC1/StrS family aminotransferase [Gammaproteobacteria bacterium]MDA9834613.1 DegT/DnrJ/EryC1/StrS family aminotransferase [Gammaproteobacteria bacterium]MDA9979384.1 DegT/DnrJ/EryC1/StrS family aminotransferase [Gammaproteobacteria bacterium]MDC3371971.1 DegT/DnrJ/EryC1/StrS family aminotransferase [Gammaproteobacteria bacterium]